MLQKLSSVFMFVVVVVVVVVVVAVAHAVVVGALAGQKLSVVRVGASGRSLAVRLIVQVEHF